MRAKTKTRLINMRGFGTANRSVPSLLHYHFLNHSMKHIANHIGQNKTIYFFAERIERCVERWRNEWVCRSWTWCPNNGCRWRSAKPLHLLQSHHSNAIQNFGKSLQLKFLRGHFIDQNGSVSTPFPVMVNISLLLMEMMRPLSSEGFRT